MPAFANRRTLALPHLRFLSLAEHLVPLTELLSHLALPNGVQLKLAFLFSTETAPLIPTVAPFVAFWVNRISPPWRTAYLSLPTTTPDDVDSSQMILAATQDFGTRATVTDWVSDAALHIRLEEDDEAAAEDAWDLQQLDAFFSRLDLTGVTNLHLQVKDEISHPDLPAVWSKMSDIQVIHVHGPDFNVTAACLFLLDTRRTATPLFPKLKIIYLDGFWISSEPGDVTGPLDSLNVLRQNLTIRVERGLRLEKIVIRERDGARPQGFGALQSLVTVEWVAERDLKSNRVEPSIDQQAVMMGIAQLIDELEHNTDLGSDMEDIGE